MPDALELLMGTVGRGWKRGGLEVREEESKEERERVCSVRCYEGRKSIRARPHHRTPPMMVAATTSPSSSSSSCCTQ